MPNRTARHWPITSGRQPRAGSLLSQPLMQRLPTDTQKILTHHLMETLPAQPGNSPFVHRQVCNVKVNAQFDAPLGQRAIHPVVQDVTGASYSVTRLGRAVRGPVPITALSQSPCCRPLS